jgi:hypothetical protein
LLPGRGLGRLANQPYRTGGSDYSLNRLDITFLWS